MTSPTLMVCVTAAPKVVDVDAKLSLRRICRLALPVPVTRNVYQSADAARFAPSAPIIMAGPNRALDTSAVIVS